MPTLVKCFDAAGTNTAVPVVATESKAFDGRRTRPLFDPSREPALALPVGSFPSSVALAAEGARGNFHDQDLHFQSQVHPPGGHIGCRDANLVGAGSGAGGDSAAAGPGPVRSGGPGDDDG